MTHLTPFCTRAQNKYVISYAVQCITWLKTVQMHLARVCLRFIIKKIGMMYLVRSVVNGLTGEHILPFVSTKDIKINI